MFGHKVIKIKLNVESPNSGLSWKDVQRMIDNKDIGLLMKVLRNSEFQEDVKIALAEIGEPAVEPLTKALLEESEQVRREVVYVLGEIGGVRVVEPLIQALKDEDENVRENAAEALGAIRDTRAVKPLIQALKDRSDRVRFLAAIALKEIKDAGAVEALIQALKDEDEYVRGSAASALGAIKDEKALEPLIQALKDEHDVVREHAAEALGELSNEKAVEPLKQVLRDQERRVREKSAKALEKMGWEPQNDAERSYYLLGKQSWKKIKEVVVPAVELLTKALKNKNSKIRKDAAEALDRIGWKPEYEEKAYYLIAKENWKRLTEVGEPAVELLLQELECQKGHDRGEIALVLGCIRDVRALEPLIKMLEDEDDEYVRGHVAEALGYMGDLRAVKPLIRALESDGKGFVRGRAAEALGKMKDERVWEPLIQSLKNGKDVCVRSWAASALGETRDARAVQPLVDAFWYDESEDVQEEAAEALGKIGEPAVSFLVQALNDDNRDVRQIAAEALEMVAIYIKQARILDRLEFYCPRCKSSVRALSGSQTFASAFYGEITWEKALENRKLDHYRHVHTNYESELQQCQEGESWNYYAVKDRYNKEAEQLIQEDFSPNPKKMNKEQDVPSEGNKS